MNSYQNVEATGKKLFVKLWLHAYRYRYKDLKVKTEVPKWATTQFEIQSKTNGHKPDDHKPDDKPAQE